jgi:hypothetical protein
VSGFSRAWAAKLLGHSWGKAEATKPAKVYLALLTSVPTNSSTGTTIEASEPTYTGHERKEVPVASIKAAEEGSPSAIKTNAELVFAACTAGSSTVTAWALCDAATAGNVVMWGTASSTVISTTQTPPAVAAEKLAGNLE